MEVQRIKQLLLLWSRIRTTRVALVGGNHTASRFYLMDIQFNKKQMMKMKTCSSYLPRSVMYENQLVITIPHSRILKVLARSVLLALVIITFPSIESFIADSSIQSSLGGGSNVDNVNSILMPSLFQDLVNEGLFKLGGKSLFVTSGNYNIGNSQILIDNEIDLVSELDQERRSSIADNSFDFIISSGFRSSEFIDRSLKMGGILVSQLNNDLAKAFMRPSNYKIVYVRKFDTTVVAMRKIAAVPDTLNSPTKRRLFAFESEEAKRAALNGLEDVILEPPRGSAAFKTYSRKTKYLPELTGDSLDGYTRRVFIDVSLPGKGGGSIEWFKNNYPTRNRVFDVFNIEMVAGESALPQIGVSDWLEKNVKKEEYIVMKAEADVVEEMISSKAINLVDELFLECKHQWQRGKKNKGKRAYWECLALYGRLRDEGVAVHQWWG
ncbi:hypothetical protein FRX31_010014 [Thalictrum thalictroides]|uniref:DUF7870 domain-containing protein n=1 Tax=Thalictrum thalictroides TaxID=46969 RepID=A0A7J6WSP6_THATH|nr:hypothetical protein FRX31_010014 [Thalictrum thalictroides]